MGRKLLEFAFNFQLVCKRLNEFKCIFNLRKLLYIRSNKIIRENIYVLFLTKHKISIQQNKQEKENEIEHSKPDSAGMQLYVPVYIL